MPVTLSVRHAPVERVALAHPGLPGLQAWRVGNRVGESPVWDAATQTLLWIDVRAPAVLRLDPRTDLVTRWALPEVVGALGLASPGTVVLALQRRIARLDLASAVLSPVSVVPGEPGHNRLNDGQVSPSGRWFVFGSMDDRPTGKQPTGALYRVGHDGDCRSFHTGLTVANGLAFSPDGSTIRFSDSHAGQVWQAPWDDVRGVMGPAVRWWASDEAAGRPDGAAVDAQGDYWSAGVSAGCLNRVGPDGRLHERVALPVRAPTMPCFGGADLQQLFVTSLVRPGWALTPADLDGSLLSWPCSTAGRPAARWVQSPPPQSP